MRSIFASTLVFLFSVSAFADQCQWNDQSVAQRARAYLAYHMGPVYSYCEPCGDGQMSRIVYGRDKDNTVDKRAVHYRWINPSEARTSGAVGWEFVFNEGFSGVERRVDLAYLFVRAENGYVNVGALFRCTDNAFWNPSQVPTTGLPRGVSPYIGVDQAPRIVDDVTDTDFARSYEQRYPNDPRG